MLATVLQTLASKATAGMSTKELAFLADVELKKLGGTPTIMGYQGFPDVICISVNDAVVHGIPSPGVVLEKGDIVGLDFCVTYEGMITDSARSVIIDQPRSAREKDLLAVTQQALYAGIEVVRDGVRTGDIGAAIEAILKKNQMGIVRDLVGHGVGHEMHEEPNVPNFGRARTGTVLHAGMTIAIEPMVTLGGDSVYVDRDGWTIRTKDGSRAAHFEHTVLVTHAGYEILTLL